MIYLRIHMSYLQEVINGLPTLTAKSLFTDLFLDCSTTEDEAAVLGWIDEFFMKRADALIGMRNFDVTVNRQGLVTAA
jgi:hypothetical protein